MKEKLTTMGIEPTIFRFEVGRLIHWATRPIVILSSHQRCIPYKVHGYSLQWFLGLGVLLFRIKITSTRYTQASIYYITKA